MPLARRFAALALASIALFASGSAAFAQPAAAPTAAAPTAAPATTKDEAKQRYLKGVELFEEGDYQAALIEFKRSYELVPKHEVLYNIGQVHFQLQDYASALKALERYLQEGDRKIPAARRSDVERDLEKLRSRVATLVVKTNLPGADVLVDGVKVGTTPLREPLLLSSGKRRIEATKQGFRTASTTEELAGQEQREIALELRPEASDGTDGAGRDGSASTPVAPPKTAIGPIVAWSATGAFAIGTGVLGGLALSADGELADRKRTPGTLTTVLDSTGSRARTFALVSDVLLGCTVLSAGVATCLTIRASSADADPASEAARLELAPTIGLGYVGVDGRF